MKKLYTRYAILFAFIFLASITNTSAQCSVNCGTGADGAYLATANTTLASGTYNFTSFTINSGAIVTVTGTQPLIIYCTGNVQIDGGLDASGGIGGDGVTFSTYGIGGVGVAGGSNGGDGVFIGSGAAGQNGLGLGAGTGGLGWSGGGGAGFSAVGASSGGGGGFGGPVYGTANLSPIYGGSGGGGGSGGNNCGSGGGGGGGGIVSIQTCGSIVIGASGQIRANGGNGGSDGTGNCGSGAGGSGGSIWLSTSGTLTNNGSIQANGGVGGSTTISGPPYYGTGGTGSAGRIRCDYGTLNGSGSFSPTIGYTAALLSVTMSSTNTSCAGGNNGSATVTATGGTSPYTYSWSPSGGNAATASGLAAGSYTCTVVDNTGCTTTVSVIITSPSALTMTGMQTNVSCYGGSNGDATVMVSGGTAPYSYSWSPSGGNGSMAMNLTAGTYTCTVTDVNGCTSTQPFTITSPPQLIATTSSTQNLCSGQCAATATVSPSGGTPGYTYSWAPQASLQATVTGLCAGTYTCTITDANGCNTTQTVAIIDPTPITVSTATVSPTCNNGCDGSATVTPSGGTPGYSYSWAPVSSSQATVTGLCAGTYSCTITDANGCSTVVTVTITNPPPIVANATSQNASCANSSDGWIAVNPVGGTSPYSYLWAPNLNTNDTINNIAAGCYTVTITDANGCTSSQSVCITAPPAIVPSVMQNNSPACFGDCTGAATVTATGGTGPLSWLWSPTGCTTQSCASLCAGTYTVAITDSTGCTATTSVDITQPAQLTAVGSHTDESLASANDGTATATASGGTAPYTYAWAPSGGTNATATGLDAGTYTCTITDANGCTTTVTVTVGTTNGVGIATINDPNFSVNLFPNPAQDHVDISVTAVQKGNVTLEVYNLVGEKVDAVEFGNVNSVNHSYNTTALANGVYFFRVSCGTNVTTRKITISH